MTETPAPATLAAALVEVQRQLPTLARDKVAKVESQRGSYSYKYVDLASVQDAVMPLLSANDLAYTSHTEFDERDRFVLVCALVHAPSKERELSVFPLPQNVTAQVLGSWISYGRRYCLASMVGLATADDDGQAASQPAKRAAPRKAAPSTPDTPPKAMSEPQLHLMMKLFRDAGYGDSEEERKRRLRYCKEIVGRPLTSAKDLTMTEAKQVIDALQAGLDEPYDDEHPGGPA